MKTDSRWHEFATHCLSAYGVFVDWHEGFFICPECEEPIYEDDWDNEDYWLHEEYHGKWYCPICENLLLDMVN